jgi:hypothetical protein
MFWIKLLKELMIQIWEFQEFILLIIILTSYRALKDENFHIKKYRHFFFSYYRI